MTTSSNETNVTVGVNITTDQNATVNATVSPTNLNVTTGN